MKDYRTFVASKALVARDAGIEVGDVNDALFDWQQAIVRWALRRGKAAIFAECGLGKTPMQLEWAQRVAEHTGKKVLVLTPLAVAHQTIREGVKFGIPARYVRDQAGADLALEAIIVTNYDMLKAFDAESFGGVVLDESSILKAFTGKTKRAILEAFEKTPYKLACTATPAPNDHLELGNHAEFLNIMPSNEMISRWFINDTMAAGSYRLKGHAERDFWRWVASWAVCLGIPSDLGNYVDDGFVLPELRLHSEVVTVDHHRAWETGRLLVDGTQSATAMWAEKRETAKDRCQRARDIVDRAEPGGTWILWCDTNNEADLLQELFPQAVEVRGSDLPSAKEEKLRAFTDGQTRVIITKPDIAGFGLNWQHCHRQVFVGVTYSFEKTYQALRRSWRFGQSRPVDAWMIYAETEGNIMATIREKQAAHAAMQANMRRAMTEVGLASEQDRRLLVGTVDEERSDGDGWTLWFGDSVETVRHLDGESVGLSVFSPPFSNLYIYSDALADMGNAADDDEFFEHFGYLIPELLRVTMAGRLCVVHCKDLPLYMNRDGAAGLADFPGRIVRAFEDVAQEDGTHWVYHSRVTIWKDPVIEMQRTKNHGLLYKNLQVRGEVCRQGMADYLVVFRKWVPDMDRVEHVRHNRADMPLEVWQRYASPVWMDIDQTDVLNFRIAREDKDEKHICPLQLGVIRRCIELWSSPGDLVYSPFAGVGSEGVVAVEMGRRFVGGELKRAYWGRAVAFLRDAAMRAKSPDLFTLSGVDVA